VQPGLGDRRDHQRHIDLLQRQVPHELPPARLQACLERTTHPVATSRLAELSDVARARLAHDGVAVDRRKAPEIAGDCQAAVERDRPPRPKGNRAVTFEVLPSDGPPVGGGADTREAALRSLYAEHGGRLRALATRMLSDPHQAEDVVQETMLRAWRKWDTIDPERGSVGTWLYRISYNVAIDRLRAKRARPPEVDESQSTPAMWSVGDHADATVNSVDMAGAIAMLTPGQRAVLHQVYFADRTCAEAAKVLGIPEGTVKSRLYQALRRLRTIVQEERH
jgi:RNA polymerase sigma-70 factor (ECF subfamily)